MTQENKNRLKSSSANNFENKFEIEVNINATDVNNKKGALGRYLER